MRRWALSWFVVAALGCRGKAPDPPPGDGGASAQTEAPRPGPVRGFLDHGQGYLHVDGAIVRVGEADPACGFEACGNGRRDSCTVAEPPYQERWTAEACDGAVPSGATCERLGYVGGELGCSEGCTWDVSGCQVCAPGRCVVHPLAPGEALYGMAMASDGSRIRLVWGAKRERDGQRTQCLYTAWAEQEGPARVLTCDVAEVSLSVLRLEARPEGGFLVESHWGTQVWRATIDEAGALGEPRLEEHETSAGTRPPCAVIDAGAVQLQLLPYYEQGDDGTRHPLQGQWLRDERPISEPFRVAGDPRGDSCGVGVVVEDSLVLTWQSMGHGLVTTRLPLPESARVVDEIAQ